MPDIVQCKLTTRTSSGKLIRSSVTLEYRDGRIWFLKSPFSLKDEIKAMRGSRWHGRDDDDDGRKIWSIEDCSRNRFQLAFLQGEDVYDWFDRPLVQHEYHRPLMPHQCDMVDSGLTYHYQIWAAEMGCVDGEAIVHVNRAGRGFKMRLCDLYHKFHGGKTRGHSWDLSIPTYIRSLKGKVLGLNRVVNVLNKGMKEVVRLTLKSGKTIRLTPDHEVCVGYGQYRPADTLKPGDVVLSNGTWIDKDGYVRVGGLKGKHPRYTTGGVYEHILVAEEKLGRPLNPEERVHHENGVRHDNRPDNLEVLASDSEHARKHGREGGFLHLHGGKSANGGLVQFVPIFDTVVSVEPDGVCEVYDVVCEDPHRNFVANGIVAHNCGKTLSAQEVMERSGADYWYWVGPKTSLPNIRREFRKWDMDTTIRVEMMTYDELTRRMDEWTPENKLPQGVIFDESSRLKGDTSQRSQAAQRLADFIRAKFALDGFVIEMSGTPSPKTPLDWWSQCEIAWPGFLREGSRKALEQRCAFVVMHQYDAGMFRKRIGWKDDERKCKYCGLFEEDGPHELDGILDPSEVHNFEPSVNEVSYMYERLKGLVVIKHKKNCLTLPDKRYRKIVCRPNPSVLRVAQAIMDGAPNTITGLTLLRELSDGFQYQEKADGEIPCPHCPNSCGEIEEWFDPADEEASYSTIDMLSEEFVSRLQKRTVPCTRCGGTQTVPKIIRITREIPCPKEKALKMLLQECEENGRIVVFAGFTGSVDRVTNICHKDGWSVFRCDGRGFQVTDREGNIITQDGEEALEFWSDRNNQRVAFVAHPESGGMSLTLVEARMAVYWSNSFKPEYRAQSEDRIHRKGMDENLGCDIVDLIHLPSDARVLEVIQANRKLELMTLGEFRDTLDEEGSDEVIIEELVA